MWPGVSHLHSVGLSVLVCEMGMCGSIASKTPSI